NRNSGGRLHLRFRQVYLGLPVWGNHLILHFDADGGIYAMNGRYIPTPSGIDPNGSRLNERQAIEQATEGLKGKTEFVDPSEVTKLIPSYRGPSAEKGIFVPETAGKARLAWRIGLRPNLRERWFSFIDARTGEIIETYQTNPRQETVNAVANDVLGASRTFRVLRDENIYSLFDPVFNIATYDAHGKPAQQGIGISLFSSPDNTWSDALAVSAHANACSTYSYYSLGHNRPGMDGKNMFLPVIVHFSLDGNPYDNAFWASEYIAFGDGKPYAAALDVVAHEMTHGVVEFTVGLEYRFQSGALNEALSDFMACMVDPDWLMGEDLPGGAIRNAFNPGEFGFPGDMSQYRNLLLAEDNGGVHINSGIPCRAFVTAAEAVGKEKAARIVYQILDALYLVPQAQFTDMRLASVQAAVDLFGPDSPEVAAVKSAFDTVGILEGAPTSPPDDFPPPDGGQWIAFLQEGFLKLGRDVLAGENDIVTLSPIPAYTGTSRPVSVFRDGKSLIFVDAENNLRGLRLDTLQEIVLDDSGVWSSIALSPNARFLAATSVYEDTTIYVFDLDRPENSKAVHLYTPSTEGALTPTALFADALDWNHSSTQILYDVFNRVPSGNGQIIEFWDVNLLDVETGLITRVRTPTDRGLQVGNPCFGRMNDRYMVCDLFSGETGYCAVMAMDFFTMESRELHRSGYISTNLGSFPNVGIPRRAPDDRGVIYQQYDSGSQTSFLYRIPLAEDRMSPFGDPVVYHEGWIPLWFIREGPTHVGEPGTAAPAVFILERNRPNPFNPATAIPFILNAPARVKLEVFDALGRRIAVLADRNFLAGKYEYTFNGAGLGSGTYIYRLRSAAAIETRKMMLLK
ncbi:MAG: M4 family metallopeptidase, partial [Candidatus Latescibacterota bacterium]